MLLGQWVASSLEELRTASIMLLKEGADLIQIEVQDEDGNMHRRYLKITVWRNQEEGDNESARRSNKDDQ